MKQFSCLVTQQKEEEGQSSLKSRTCRLTCCKYAGCTSLGYLKHALSLNAAGAEPLEEYQSRWCIAAYHRIWAQVASRFSVSLKQCLLDVARPYSKILMKAFHHEVENQKEVLWYRYCNSASWSD